MPMPVLKSENRENGRGRDVVVRLQDRIAAIVHRLNVKLSRDRFEVRPCQCDSSAHRFTRYIRLLMMLAGQIKAGGAVFAVNLAIPKKHIDAGVGLRVYFAVIWLAWVSVIVASGETKRYPTRRADSRTGGSGRLVVPGSYPR